MKKDINGDVPDSAQLVERELIEHSPALYYLEANKYYLLKDERAFRPDGSLGAKALTYLNENLGLEVVLTWPSKVAQVFIVTPAGSQQVAVPMESLYENPEFLMTFLIDISRMRHSMKNTNQSNYK